MLVARRWSALLLVGSLCSLAACGDRAGEGESAPELKRVAQGLGEAPVNSLPGQQSINEDSPLFIGAANGNEIIVDDADSAVLTVQVDVTNGTYTPSGSTRLTVTGSGTSSVLLTGAIPDLNFALNSNGTSVARFNPAANFVGTATLQFTTSDSNGNSTIGSVQVIINPVNDAPINNVPTAAQNATEDIPRAFNLSVNDVDVGTGTMRVTLTSSNGTLITLAERNFVSFEGGATGISEPTMTFTGTLPNINAALNGITVTPPLDFIGTSTLLITTNDQGNFGSGDPGEDTDTLTINWAAVNDPPVNSVPVAQTIAEEGSLVFSSANGTRLSTSDVDVTTSFLQVTLSATGGVLTLGGTSAISFSSGDGTDDATMTFSGTLANVNVALEGTRFVATPDFAGAAMVTLITSDLGNSGAGGAKQDTDTVSITVTGSNDAPTVSGPTSDSTEEDVARAFSTGNANALLVADVDASSLQVTLSATNGTLSLGSKGGLTFTAGDGTADGTMTFTGMIGQINQALNGLSFAPTANFHGQGSITLNVSDQGATGAGGPKTALHNIAVNVTSVNDAPDAVNDAVALDEDSPPTVIQVLLNDTWLPDQPEDLTLTAVTTPANGTATIDVGRTTITYQPTANYFGTDSFSYTVSDGNGGFDTATVTVTVRPVNDPPRAEDDTATVLQNSGPNPISVLSNDTAAPDVGETLRVSSTTSPANGTVTITGGGTGLSYAPAAVFTGTDSFTYTVSDGNGGTDIATVTVTVTEVNVTPVNSLPPPQRTVEDTQLFFSSTAGNPITVADQNSPTLTVQISVTNGTFTLGSTTGLTVTSNNTASVTAVGTIAALNNGLNNSRYTPTLNFHGDSRLTISTSDSTGESDLDELTLTVTSSNDAPVNTVPTGIQAGSEDTPKAFTSILVSDVDIGAAPLLVTLTADNETRLTLSRTDGLAFSAGDGSDDATMSFSGTLANINAALNGLTVTPPLNFIGTSTLVITTDDQGNSGSGGAGQDTDTLTLSWAAVNDAPVNSVPGIQDTIEETPLTLSTANANALSVSDVDASAGLVQITLNANGGTLSLGGLSGLTFSAGDGAADATMTFTGNIAAVNTALNGTVFTPNANFAGSATVTLVTSDLGNSGAGGAKQDTDTLTIRVAAVNDAPTHSVPSAQTTNEDVARTFSVNGGNPITVGDVDATSLQVSLSVTGGTLTLGTKTGLSFQEADGTADPSMTFTGTIAQLNAALNGLTFTPTPNFHGSVALRVFTSDLGEKGTGGPMFREDIIFITVTSVNDAPDAVNDAFTLAEDAPPTELLVLGNDTTLPDTGETLVITAVSTSANGTASVSGNGTSVTYQANANFNGTDSFSYTVSDGNGGTDSATVTLTVTPVNDPPTAADDGATVLQNASATAIGVLSNDSAAPDVGETLTIIAFSTPGSGTVNITGGGTGINYTPASGFSGTDTFTYTISDGNGGTATATVTVNVAPVNPTPVNSLPPPQRVVEDTPLTFSSTAGNAITVADANSATLTVQISVTNGIFTLGGTAGLTVSGNSSTNVTVTGTLSALNTGFNNSRFTPAANYSGPATLTINSSDSTGESDLDTLTLMVDAVNDAPIHVGVTATVSAVEDTPKTFSTLSITDVDVGAASLSMTITASNETLVSLSKTTGLFFSVGDGLDDATMTFTGTLPNINAAVNGLTVTPPLNYIGASTLVLSTSDLGNTGSGGARQDDDTMTLNWAADNDAPVNAVPGPQEMLEEGTLLFSSTSGTGISVSDVDVGAGLMQVTFAAASGRLTLGNPGVVTITAGTASNATTMTFRGTLTNVNSALEGSTFVPNANFVGAASVTVTTSDLGNTGGAAKTAASTIAVNVVGVNDAPVNTVPAPQFMNEDTTLTFSTATGNPVRVADVDAVSLQVTLSATNGQVSLTTKTGLQFQGGDGNSAPSMTFTGPVANLNTALNTLKFQADPNFEGTAFVTILTNDLGETGIGGALFDEDTIQISVIGVNDPPTAVSDAFTVDEDALPTDFDVLANDSDAPDTGETLSISATSVPANGTVTNNGTSISYQPKANFNGTDTFTYTLSDGRGGTRNANVTVTVTAVNDPPDAVDDAFTVGQESTATTLNVRANDSILPDTGEVLTIISVSQAASGTVTITSGGVQVTYQPNPGFYGEDAFSYTVSDGNGGTDTAQVVITVTEFDYKPVANNDTLTVAEDGSGAVDVLANDTALGNSPVTVTIKTQPTSGTAAVQVDDTILYTPNADYVGSDTFSYTVRDANGDEATASVSVTVTPTDDTPVAVADSASTAEDTSVKVRVLDNDTGIADSPITVTVTVQPTRGTAMVEVDQTITYVPSADYNGPDSFTYTVRDFDGQTSSAVVNVTVTAVNDAPALMADSASTRSGQTVLIDVLSNDADVDGDPLTITAITQPEIGTGAITADQKVSFTPTATFVGTMQFTYTVSDGNGGSSTGAVIVGVGIDTDGDGLLDVDELEAGTDPADSDSDDDGINDGLEVHLTRTDPLDDDSDDDGILDGTEDANRNGVVDPGETDALKADTDGDLIQDGTELGLAEPQGSGTNMGVFVADLHPASKTDPLDADTDNGGVDDGVEDANQNGRVDEGETDPTQAWDDDPAGKDSDQDGVPDATDNCRFDANAGQEDADKNGIGDVCDSAPPTGCGCGASSGDGVLGTMSVFFALLLCFVAGRRRERSVRSA